MTEIIVVQGDITQYESDVIVNAANSSLLGGGGVDGAIHRAAGPELLAACRALNGARTGEAKMTGAFRVTTAKKIIHTVGPVYNRVDAGRAAELLAACYRNSLELAADFRSIAFPAISTGVYGYPIEEASVVAVHTIRGWLDEHPHTALETVTLIAFGAPDFATISAAVTRG